MYEWKVLVRVPKERAELAAALKKLTPPDGIIPEIKAHAKGETLRAHHAVVILEEKDLELLPKIRQSAVCEDLTCVLLAKNPAALSDEIYENIDKVWPDRPGERVLLRFYGKLLNQLAVKRQASLMTKLFTSLSDASPALVWVKDAKGAHLEVNEAFCKTVGKTKEMVRGRGHYYIWDIPEEEYNKGEYVCMETDIEVMNHGKTDVFDEIVKTKSGMRRFNTWKAPLYDEDNEIMGTVGIAHDKTDFLNLGAEMRMLLNHMPFAVAVTDRHGIVTETNALFREWFDVLRDEAEGHHYSELSSKMRRLGWQFSPERNNEIFCQKDGQRRFITINKRNLNDVFNKNAGSLVVFHDITKERQATLELRHEADTDALTGLNNRRFFFEECARRRVNARNESIIYIDLDKFKLLNDVHGHDAGDRALCEVADCMRTVFLDTDAVLARIGGDEFVVYLRDQSVSELKLKARRLLDAVGAVFSGEGDGIKLEISVGIARAQALGGELADLMRQADETMYRAKREHAGFLFC